MESPEDEAIDRQALLQALGFLSRPHAFIQYKELNSAGRASGNAHIDVLQLRSGGNAKAIGVIRSPTLMEMLRQGWISLNADKWRLTRAGRFYVKRGMAQSDPFQEQHQERGVASISAEGRTENVVINHAESPLAWLRKRRGKKGRPFLSNTQFDAGEKLRADFHFAQMSPRVTANWGDRVNARKGLGHPSQGSDIADHVIAAKKRVERALEAVGPELSGVLIDICCIMKGLEAVEKDKGWPQRSGKIVLSLALNSLARHYGLLGDDRPGERRGKIEHWGAGDFKPNLDTWQ